jgi:hypothetical protein
MVHTHGAREQRQSSVPGRRGLHLSSCTLPSVTAGSVAAALRLAVPRDGKAAPLMPLWDTTGEPKATTPRSASASPAARRPPSSSCLAARLEEEFTLPTGAPVGLSAGPMNDDERADSIRPPDGLLTQLLAVSCTEAAAMRALDTGWSLSFWAKLMVAELPTGRRADAVAADAFGSSARSSRFLRRTQLPSRLAIKQLVHACNSLQWLRAEQGSDGGGRRLQHTYHGTGSRIMYVPVRQ